LRFEVPASLASLGIKWIVLEDLESLGSDMAGPLCEHTLQPRDRIGPLERFENLALAG
jgi:hypothetical protein